MGGIVSTNERKMQGIKVLDLSMFLPGPHLTMTLADHGADVIRVEPPGGDPTRQIGFFHNGESVYFRNTHRGKRSLTLNLKIASARELVLKLAEQADVFVESFRPGAIGRLGLDYDTVAARAPHIIYCSISAYGQTGPMVDRVAHDIAVEAQAGVASLTLGHDGKPTLPAIAMADMTASLMSLSAILMALYRVRDTGRGDYIDLAMQDSLLAWMPNTTGRVFAEGKAPDPRNERSWGGNAMYNLYQTADSKWLALAGAEMKFTENLFNALGHPEYIAHCDNPPGPLQEPARQFLRDTFLSRTLDDWMDWFEGRDICYAPVNDLREGFDQPQVAAREMLLRDADGGEHIGVPIKYRHEPAVPDLRAPKLGEHNLELCLEAGLQPNDYHAMCEESAFGPIKKVNNGKNTNK